MEGQVSWLVFGKATRAKSFANFNKSKAMKVISIPRVTLAPYRSNLFETPPAAVA